MTEADLPGVEAVADIVHTDFPEDGAVFAERLLLYPAGCLVLAGSDGIIGYAVSHPWLLFAPPELDTLLGGLPEGANTLYIHDMAMTPAARGLGEGKAGLKMLLARAEAEGLASLSLIAVSGSVPFWEGRGFRVAPLSRQKLESYGEAARYMIRE